MSGDSTANRFPPTRILRALRRHCWRGLVWFVIGSAVLVSIGRLLAPQADALRPLVEDFLSQSFDRPVRIERIEASWPRFSPRVRLLGLEVGDPGQRLLGVDRAMLEFKLYNLLRPGRNSFELIVLGVDVRLAQNDDGQWTWQMERGGQFTAGWERSLSAGDLVLRDSGIRIVPNGFPELDWSVPEASLNRIGDQLQVQLRVLPQDDADQAFEARLKLEMPDSRLETVSGFAQAPDFELAHPAFNSFRGAAKDFRAQMKSWLEWSRSDGGRAHAQVDLHSLDAAGIAGVASSRFFVDASWADGEFRVEINAQEFGSSDSSLITGLAYGGSRGRQALVAERIDLAYLHALASPWLGRAAAWPSLLEGRARDLAIGWTADDTLYLAGGHLDNIRVGFDAPDLSMSVESLELELAGDRLRAHPRGRLELQYPFLYAEPVGIDQLSGSLTLLDGGLVLDGLELQHPEFSLSADGLLHPDADGLFVDLLVDVERFEPRSLRAWLPEHGLPPKTRGWLNEALTGLDSAGAVTTLFGRPANWGKRVPPGALNSVVEFSGLDLAYARRWPTAENVHGSVEFLGESMAAVARRGKVAEVSLRANRAYIGQLRNAELELSLESIDSSAADLARLMAAFPLQAANQALEFMSWQGPATASAEVWFPVKQARDWRLTGAVEFNQAELELPDQEIVLRQLAGLVPFNRRRIGPAELDAELIGERVRFDLDSWLGPEFRLSLTGAWPTLGLVPGAWRRLRPELEREISGISEWSIGFHPLETGADAALVMRLSGDLAGTRLDFPQPLAKTAAARWPFEFVVPLGEALEPLEFQLGSIVNGKILENIDRWQVGLGFGGTPASLPVDEHFLIEGGVETLELDDWIGILAAFLQPAATDRDSLSGRPAGDQPVRQLGDRVELGPADLARPVIGLTGWLDLETEQLLVGRSSLDAVHMALGREDQYWRLNAQGRRLDGTVRILADGSADQPIVASFKHLHWPGLEPETAASDVEPGTLSPKQVPPFHFAIDDFRYGELEMGEVRWTSHKSAEGLEIEQLSTRRDGLEIVGDGRWIEDDEIRTRMRLRMTDSNLGRSLREAGFDLALERGQASIRLGGSWPGGPTDFALRTLDGELDLEITDGSIPEASPGAGRILGLVSLNSIPRRLRLDFTDVFGEGFGFDRVSGHFDLDDGIASTGDLKIDAPAAEVEIRGQTDLHNRTYDQTITVKPGFGSALPIIGALAGGPVGAAAGAALQQLFSKPLKGISEIQYAVTGTWENPVIEPVRVRPAEL